MTDGAIEAPPISVISAPSENPRAEGGEMDALLLGRTKVSYCILYSVST